MYDDVQMMNEWIIWKDYDTVEMREEERKKKTDKSVNSLHKIFLKKVNIIPSFRDILTIGFMLWV